MFVDHAENIGPCDMAHVTRGTLVSLTNTTMISVLFAPSLINRKKERKKEASMKISTRFYRIVSMFSFIFIGLENRFSTSMDDRLFNVLFSRGMTIVTLLTAEPRKVSNTSSLKGVSVISPIGNFANSTFAIGEFRGEVRQLAKLILNFANIID
jgi:hypothetical protein